MKTYEKDGKEFALFGMSKAEYDKMVEKTADNVIHKRETTVLLPKNTGKAKFLQDVEAKVRELLGEDGVCPGCHGCNGEETTQ